MCPTKSICVKKSFPLNKQQLAVFCSQALNFYFYCIQIGIKVHTVFPDKYKSAELTTGGDYLSKRMRTEILAGNQWILCINQYVKIFTIDPSIMKNIF